MTSAALALAAALLAAGDAQPCARAGGGAGSPCAPAAEDVRERVRALLGAIDRPVRPETWRALGPEAEGVLAEIAISAELPSRRAKALEGLAAFAGPRSESVHRRLAGDEAAPLPVRRSAIRGLGRLVAADRVVGVLRGFLEDERDASVRSAAAEVLARRAPAAACGAIRAQARREGSRGDALFRRALAACER
jgi:hypothetical protein